MRGCVLFEFSTDQQTWLLALARSSLKFFLEMGRFPDPPLGALDDILLAKCGVFVTLKSRETRALRGCIGYIVSDTPLWATVVTCAISAAVSDSRFAPMRSLQELASVSISISVLTPPVKIVSAEFIQLGKHGIILKKLGRQAVFLPEVPVEMHWNLETMLTALSQKAGLSKTDWQNGAEFEVFESIKFGEATGL